MRANLFSWFAGDNDDIRIFEGASDRQPLKIRGKILKAVFPQIVGFSALLALGLVSCEDNENWRIIPYEPEPEAPIDVSFCRYRDRSNFLRYHILLKHNKLQQHGKRHQVVHQPVQP